MCRLFRVPHVAWIAAFFLCGCSADYFRSETELHSDGRIDRAIFQPAQNTPPEARQDAAWSEVRMHERIAPDAWNGSIRDLPAGAVDPENANPLYFAAWGTFASPEAIPDTVRFSSPEGTQHAGLKRRYERNDCVFVVEHVWEETLENNVTLEGLRAAREELSALLIEYAGEALAIVHGPEFDSSAVLDWLRTDGTELFRRLTETVYDTWMSPGRPTERELMAKLEPIAAEYGIAMLDEPGLKQFAETKLRELLKKKDGSPIEEQKLEGILRGLQLREEAESCPHDKQGELQGLLGQYDARFGGKEAFTKHLLELLSRMVGLHAGFPFSSPRAFEYLMKVPGEVVETTGTLLSENEVRWKFDNTDVRPYGYVIRCRSLEAKPELELRVFGERRLDTREAMLRFVDMAGKDKLLRDALRASAAAGSAQPLRNLLRERSHQPPTEGQASPRAVHDLLLRPRR